MLYSKGKSITGIYNEGKEIIAVYDGLKLVWRKIKEIVDEIQSCYAHGYWIDDLPWTDDTPWTD